MRSCIKSLFMVPEQSIEVNIQYQNSRPLPFQISNSMLRPQNIHCHSQTCSQDQVKRQSHWPFPLLCPVSGTRSAHQTRHLLLVRWHPIHPDLPHAILLRRRLGQPDDAVLAGVIRGLLGEAFEDMSVSLRAHNRRRRRRRWKLGTFQAVYGSHVDDRPAVHNLPQLGAQAVHHPRQVDRDDAVPFVIV